MNVTAAPGARSRNAFGGMPKAKKQASRTPEPKRRASKLCIRDRFVGLDALYFARPMADFLSGFTTLVFIIVEMRRLRKLERGEITAKF